MKGLFVREMEGHRVRETGEGPGASFFFRLIQLLHVPDSEAPAQILSDSRHPALVASQAQHRLAMDKTVATGTRLLKVYVPSTVTGCKSQRSRL